MTYADEAHRLKYRKKGHLSNYRSFDDCNRALGLDPQTGTELDWLFLCSSHIVLFRDELQTVRPCDIDVKEYRRTVSEKYPGILIDLSLSTQWRCKGGNDYVDYIRNILSGLQSTRETIEDYELYLYNDCAKMISDVQNRNSECGLCRTVAGYAWPWDRKHPDINTIMIQGKRYRWNRVYDNWINTPSSIEEIGCIHTVQGYDLNYAGVIIGEDIKYNPEKHELYAVKDNYYDQQGKSGISNDPVLLKEYLTNIYLTLLTRGIRGTYLYVCNEELRQYMKRFIPVR